MKKSDLNSKDGTMTGPSDPERRRVTKMIGVITLLGMGLGVNLDEVFGGARNSTKMIDKKDRPTPAMGKVEKPSADFIKIDKPSVTQDKYSPTRTRPGVSVAKPVPAKPDASFAKTSPAKPGASFAKTSPAKSDASFAKTSTSKPGASFAKTSPAKPGVSIAKPVPANKPGVNLMKINTLEESGEQLLNIPGAK